MKKFDGFPRRMEFTPVPNAFINRLLSDISDINELKITLHLFKTIYGKKGSPRFAALSELLNDKGLLNSLKGKDKKPQENVKEALALAVKRGTILSITVDKEGKPEDIYFINTESDRQVVSRIKNGEFVLSGLKTGGPGSIETEERPDLFTLYEQNIGMLTPMISEELREAEKNYPETWIADAIKEAVSLNIRNWRYIAKILENWSVEGRGDGTHRRDIKKSQDKYTEGEYGHIVKR